MPYLSCWYVMSWPTTRLQCDSIEPLDFGKLESMAAATAPESLWPLPAPGEATGDGSPPPSPSSPLPPPPPPPGAPGSADINITSETHSSGHYQYHPSRFSRYLLFAQNRRNRRHAATLRAAPVVIMPTTNRDVSPSALVSSDSTHSQT